MSERRTSLENEVILATSVLYLLIVGVMVIAHVVAVVAEHPEPSASQADRMAKDSKAEVIRP